MGSHGLASEKAAVLVVGNPRDRRAAPIAALVVGPEADAVGVLQVLVGDIGLGQAQLLALVEADRAAQAQQQPRIEPPRILAEVPAAGMAHHVMVGKRPAGPAIADGLLVVGDDLAHRVPASGDARQELEGIAHVHLVAAGGVLGLDLQPVLGVADLAHGRAAGYSSSSARNRRRNSRFSGWFLS
jgi:hypothetical protein